MEIFTNLTSCPVCGNYYNADNHSQCPICSGAQAAQGSGSFGATEAPSFAQPASPAASSFSPTVSPDMAQPEPPSVLAFGATQPVNNPHMAQAQSEPFSPTVSIM